MFKFAILSLLIVQTSSNVLLMRKSRLQDIYPSSLIVLYVEIFKFGVCLGIFFLQNDRNLFLTWNALKVKIIYQPEETVKLSIPSLLYAMQNNLLFYALANLDATSFQVTYQLKILVTSLMATLYLNKPLFLLHWTSLVILTIGITIVQLSHLDGDSISDSSHKDGSTTLGLLSVVAASFSSSFSGIYFEKLVKSGKKSLIIRNIQLGMFSIVFSCCMAIYSQGSNIFFFSTFQDNFDILVGLIILIQGLGGLLVSVVIKYADNILKGFATSISIIVSNAGSYFILNDYIIDFKFLLGTCLVILATALYSWAESHRKLAKLAGESNLGRII